MSDWPNQAGMNAFYGNPDVNNDGVADLAWQQANLTTITPPYPVFYIGKPVKAITCHKKVADSLLKILTEIGQAYDQVQRRQLGLDEFGGVYNFRRKRGGLGLSIHSWAAAIDLAPSINRFGRAYREQEGMMPMKVVRIFEKYGWTWGGLWGKADGMHFQAASVR